MREKIPLTERFNVDEPGFGSVSCRYENVFCNPMENIVGEASDHIEETELSYVEESRSRKRPSQEVNYTIRSLVKKFL